MIADLAEQYPQSIVILNILGVANAELGNFEKAAGYFHKSVQTKPDDAEAHNYLGVTLQTLDRRDEAIECYSRALRIKPDYADAHQNFGNTLKEQGRHDEAIECYSRALQIKPDYASAYSQKLHVQAQICDWHALSKDRDAIVTLGMTGASVIPFAMLALEDHPARHLQRSRRYVADNVKHTILSPIHRPATKPDRLRIGYFSADFRNHAVSYLIAKLFELHDRDRFSLHAYSYGPDKNDEMRTRLIYVFDVFHDVLQENDDDVAELARKEGIDIAVDLNGHTTGSRSGIFAYRAAPIQINYLGYPGTTGAPFMDYIIADKTVIPEDQIQYYSEKVIYLPHTYQVNDNTRKISDKPISRSELGLPETGLQ